MSNPRVAELLELSLGNRGSVAITDTSETTASKVFTAIQVIADAEFSAQTDKGTTNADLTTKLTIIGNETGGQASINVTSSKLIVEPTNSSN